MKYLIIILSLFFIGCGNIKAHLNDLPSIAFKSVEYNRSGTFSTALIQADGAYVKDGVLYIKNVKIVESWPIGSVYFQMQGYSRKLEIE